MLTVDIIQVSQRTSSIWQKAAFLLDQHLNWQPLLLADPAVIPRLQIGMKT
jgi:hypothetical protein